MTKSFIDEMAEGLSEAGWKRVSFRNWEPNLPAAANSTPAEYAVRCVRAVLETRPVNVGPAETLAIIASLLFPDAEPCIHCGAYAPDHEEGCSIRDSK